MQHCEKVILLMALLLTVKAETAPINAATTRKEIETVYGKLATTMKRRDLPAMLQFYTPDYKRKESNGTVSDRAQFKSAMMRVMKSQQVVREVKFRISMFQATNTTATVTAKAFLKARVQMLDSQNHPVPGSAYEMAATWPVREFWVKTPAGWRIKSTKLLAATRANVEKQ